MRDIAAEDAIDDARVIAAESDRQRAGDKHAHLEPVGLTHVNAPEPG